MNAGVPGVTPNRDERLTRAAQLTLFVFALLRVLSVVKLPPARFRDTAGYFDLSFSGHSPRLWTVPLFFKIVRGDDWRVVVQVIIAIGCWTVLATTIATSLRDARARLAAVVLVCAFGLSYTITNWDLTILSDSLSISLTVLLLACWWQEVVRPTRWSAVTLVVVTVLWTFTRQSDVALNHLVVVVVLVSLVWTRGRNAKLRRAAVALALLGISAWGQFALSNDHFVTRVNINSILIQRISKVDAYMDWWLDHGLPKVPHLFAEVDPDKPQYDPDYVAWLDEHGESTYALFLLTHPDYTLASPWKDFLPVTYGQLENRDEPSMIGMVEHYGRSRQVLPAIIESILVEPGAAGTFLAWFGATLGTLAFVWRRHGYDRRWTVPLVTLLLEIPHVLIVWHGSNAELGRHSLALAVSTRLAVFALAVTLLDGWLVRRTAPGEPALEVVRAS